MLFSYHIVGGKGKKKKDVVLLYLVALFNMVMPTQKIKLLKATGMIGIRGPYNQLDQ